MKSPTLDVNSERRNANRERSLKAEVEARAVVYPGEHPRAVRGSEVRWLFSSDHRPAGDPQRVYESCTFKRQDARKPGVWSPSEHCRVGNPRLRKAESVPGTGRGFAPAMMTFLVLFSLLMSTPAAARTLRIVGTTEVAGREITVPLQFVAQGDENALSFSLSWDPALLTWMGDAAGTGTSGASLIRNTNQLANGKIGYALARPYGQHFASGTNELLRLRFQLGLTVINTPLAFTTTPILLETVDDAANLLNTEHTDGVITITPLLPPAIVTQPQGATVQPIANVATNITLSVAASGSPPLFYAWRIGENSLVAATNSTLTLTNVTPADSGGYEVVVSNSGGAVTSQVAVVTILPALVPPSITLQPRSSVASTGETVLFGLAATGTEPLRYQWRFNSTPMIGQTNSSLLLTNVAPANNGSYSCAITNLAGSVTSANASLAVSAAGRLLRVGQVDVPTAGEVDLPVELIALGDENAVGFSLMFDPSRLRFISATPGAGAADASLLVNTNVGGHVGLAIVKPTGRRFSAGVANLLNLRLRAGDLSGPTSVIVTNRPVELELADEGGNPRPLATADGLVNVLSTAPSLLTQPLSTTNAIFSTAQFDVRAGGSVPIRYQWQFNGEDLQGQTDSTLTLPGVRPNQSGAYRAIVSNPVSAVTSLVATLTVPRMVRVVGTNAPTGNLVDVPLQLLAHGDENAAGFTLRFDPAQLAFQGILSSNGVGGPTLNVNTNLAAGGSLGFVVAQAYGSSFASGTQQLAAVRFLVSGMAGDTPLIFADQPVLRELVDNATTPLLVAFQPGTLTAQLVPPVITQHPVSREVASEATVAFTVAATGSLPLGFQWLFNSSPVQGATNATYTIVSAQPANSGAYAVQVRNAASTITSSNALLVVTPPDTNGPTVLSVRYGAEPVRDGLSVAQSDTFGVTATDASGVGRAEFWLNDSLLESDTTGSDGFTAFWNIDLFSDGPYRLVLKVFDWRNNVTLLTNDIVLAMAPPPAPTISHPASGAVVSDLVTAVRGNALKNTQVKVYRNGDHVGTPVPVSLQGKFETTLALVEGTNRLQAAAQNRAGEGPRSASVVVVLDTSIPQPPSGLQALARDGGRIQIQWVSAQDSAKGFYVYRSTSSFTNVSQATRLTPVPTAETSFVDLPPADGRYFYRISGVNAAKTEGSLSAEVSATSDTTSPLALLIEYRAHDAYDAATGRFGRGLVDATVHLSEAVSGLPFFSLTPAGGLPIVVELKAGADNTFTGTFALTDSTPSGMANAVLSTRDLAGNRGSTILDGSQLLIDTAGPEVTALAISPSRSISNSPAQPATVSFNIHLTESLRANTLPQFSYTLSKTAVDEIPVASVAAGTNDLNWIVTLTLPGGAGQPLETLTLHYRGEDDLGNVGTRIAPPHEFQVYQGELPALEIPPGLSAKSLPAGAIQLLWIGVPEAADYQLFRKTPDQPDFEALTRTGGAVTYTDLPPTDGLYQYAVASVRRENNQESVSQIGSVVSVRSDRVAPAPPSALAVSLAGNGAFVRWTPSNNAEPVTFNLYRTNRGPVVSFAGMVPLIARIPVGQVVDPNPTPQQPYYAVAAVDEVGNVSAPSNTGYLNAELLPPSTIDVALLNDGPPIVSWTQSGGTVQGHNLYLGEDTARLKANTGGLITTRTYTDQGYSGDERRYTVAAVDVNQQEGVGRSLRLPRVSAILDTNAPVKRGLMNQLVYAVTNASNEAIGHAQLRVVLGGRNHLSAGFELPAASETTIPVVVAGYPELPLSDTTPLTTTIEIRPNQGELVSVSRNGRVATTDGQLIIGVMASDFLRGGSAKVKFSLLNPGGAEIEVLTARGGGSQPSPDIRFTLLDADGHVLSTAPYQASVGPALVNLPNGDTVMRLEAGAQASSSTTLLTVPASVPGRVFVRVEIDRVYYHSDREDRVVMDGVQTRAEFAVVDTSYTALVTTVSPAESRGDQPVVISGVARFRRTDDPAPNVPLLVKIASAGFERTDSVLTDANGAFSTTFQPLSGEAGGVYSVWAVHPDLNDRTVQATFVIKRVLVNPTQFGVRAPYSFPQSVSLGIATGPGTTVTNLHLEYRAQDQPNGQLLPGVSVGLGDPVSQLGPGQNATLNLTFTGSAEAPRSPRLVLFVTSDDAGPAGWQKLAVACEFSEARPFIRWAPDMVDTGVAPGSNVTETVTFENVGLVSARGMTFALLQTDGTPAPVWASLTTPTNLAELKVGDRYGLDLTFQPPPGTAEGDYEFLLRTAAENHARIDRGVHVAVVSSGRGGVQFKVLDMYSGLRQTNRTDGTVFVEQGVDGALIRLQNELVQSEEYNLVTTNGGEAVFADLPAGQYKFHVTADRHQGSNGRVWVRAGTTVNQEIALTYSLVSVEWEVVPITIQDRYEIVLNATFETDVPAPVLTIEPGVVNLPQLFAGDVYYGEFSVYNRGLIRADHFRFALPASDEQFEYELLTGIPDHLDAHERLRVPYRLTCRKTMPGPNTRPTPALASARGRSAIRLASNVRLAGGGSGDCYTYSAPVNCSGDGVCENGLPFPCGASSGYYYNYSPGCAGGGVATGGGTWYGGGGESGAGGALYTAMQTAVPGSLACFPGEGGCQPTSQCECCPNKQQEDSWVNLLSREYQDEVEDLTLKVLGGEARVTRQFYRNQWHWSEMARRLVFKQGASGIEIITRNLVDYVAVNSAHTLFQYREISIARQADGTWRWQDKDGKWDHYDANGRLIDSGLRNLTLVKYAYDPDGRLAGQTDQNDNALFIYHYTGSLVERVEDRTGREVRYSYTDGRPTKVVDALGRETLYQYDGSGRITWKRSVGGRISKITYDSGGYVYSVLNETGNGNYYGFSYDKNRREYHSQVRTTGGQVKEKVFGPDGMMIRWAQNGILQQNSLRDSRSELRTGASGAVTLREYDEFGNLVKEVKPDGAMTTWEYELRYHQPTRIVDPRGAVTLMSYDGNGNLTNKIEAAGTPIARTNSWVYDADNLLVRRIDGRGSKMDYAYDASGNLLREYDPENSAYQTTYGYDLRGNRTALTNALGFATFHGYDASNRLVAETNALGHVTLYTYAGKNLFEVETGRDGTTPGRIVRYHYDDHDRRTQTMRVDGEGQEHVWETTTYDADGRVIAVANALGQTTRYEYNTLGQRVKIARPFNATETSDTRYEYDEYGRLAREIDPLGVITQTEYNALDRERKVTEALGTPVQRSRQSGYDLAGNLTSLTYSDGTNTFTTLYAYDLLNRRTQIRGAREYPKDFDYDASDNLTSEINGRGYRTEYAYDQYSRRTNSVEGIGSSLTRLSGTLSHPMGEGRGEGGEHASSFVYDLLGRVVTSYDGNWNHRHYHHDALGRQTEQSIPLAPTNALPAVNWWTDNSLVLNRTWFNPWGQPVATSNIVGGVTATVYDAFGRRFTHIDAAGLTLTNTYNELDQLLHIGYPVVSSAPLGSPPTSIRYAYDAYNAQMLVSTTDRANLTTRYGYDRRFQRASELSSWGALTTYHTDELGRQTAVTNALNEVTQSVFDQFEQLVATIYADHIPVTQERIEYRAYDEFGKMTNHWGAATYDVLYAYDLGGNQVSLTDGNRNTTRWEYDGRNRKVRKIYADNSNYEYGYDANGNQTRKRDAMQRTTRYEFNAHNLLVRTDYPNDPDVTFGYDPAGRRVLMVDGTGTNTWNYDAAARVLTNAQCNVQHAVSYTYDAEGNRLSMTVTPLADGEVWRTDYTYDTAARLENFTDHGVSETPFRYTWATNAVRLAALTYPSGLKSTHDYDVLGRKTLLSTRDSANVETALFAYGHDKAGQRNNETTLTHTDRFEYDAKRQLISAQRFDLSGNANPNWSYRYAYDPIGNWTTASDPDGVHHYTVNTLNQYTAVTNAPNRTFEYDANGNLLADGTASFAFGEDDHAIAASNAVERASFRYDGLGRRLRLELEQVSDAGRFIYDGGLVIAKLSSQPSQSFRVSRGLDMSLSRDRLGGIGGLVAVTSVGDRSELIADAKGSIRYEHDVSDSLMLDYAPFGLPTDLEARHQPFGFSSKELVGGVALADFGQRYLLPSCGRWAARDPIEEEDSPNIYCFVRNNPINRIDPWGAASAPAPAPAPAPTPAPAPPVCPSVTPPAEELAANYLFGCDRIGYFRTIYLHSNCCRRCETCEAPMCNSPKFGDQVKCCGPTRQVDTHGIQIIMFRFQCLQNQDGSAQWKLDKFVPGKCSACSQVGA